MRAMDSDFVSRHAFSPLLHYTKTEKRYKKDAKTGVRAIVNKERPIKYASHRDACILSFYAHQLNFALDQKYKDLGLNECVIAYRTLGKGNYNFSAEVLDFAKSKAPVTILAFDVTGFFDNLDHALLKLRLKSVLGTKSLSDDWLKVFRSITKFHFVDLNDLKDHSTFGPRLKGPSNDRIASVEELKTAGVKFRPNPEVALGRCRGIPQGTPISAAASNLYMIDFDSAAKRFCDRIGALFRRYSDDILVVCNRADATMAESEIKRLIAAEKLEVAAHKTERTEFELGGRLATSSRAAQYLGFTFHQTGPAIRESSLSRQWRKMRRAMKRIKNIAIHEIAIGHSNRAFTKRLRKRFTYLKVRDEQGVRTIRNFSSYGRRSALAFGPEEKISRQLGRFERAALRELAEIKSLRRPKAP